MGWDEHIELFLSLYIIYSEFGPSVFANWHPLKLGSYSLIETGRHGAIALDLKGMALRSLRMMFSDYNPGKMLLKRFTFQRGRKFTSTSVLKSLL